MRRQGKRCDDARGGEAGDAAGGEAADICADVGDLDSSVANAVWGASCDMVMIARSGAVKN
jgi:hypothetical protein